MRRIWTLVLADRRNRARSVSTLNDAEHDPQHHRLTVDRVARLACAGVCFVAIAPVSAAASMASSGTGTGAATTAATSPPSRTTSGVASACELLSPADLQSVLGGTVGAGDLSVAPAGGESICEWTVTTAPNGSGYGAQLDIKAPFSAKDFKQQRQIASGVTKTVKHLGDGAFSERAKLGAQIYDDLWVHTNGVAFRLEVLEDLGVKPLVTLASTVLTNLGGRATQ